jgi:hypothetical protein
MINLLKNTEEELKTAFNAVEGEFYWTNSNYYSSIKKNPVFTNYNALGVRQSLLKMIEESPYWDGCFIIYGNSGYSRYFVYIDGTIKYSKWHGRSGLSKAIVAGFEIAE